MVASGPSKSASSTRKTTLSPRPSLRLAKSYISSAPSRSEIPWIRGGPCSSPDYSATGSVENYSADENQPKLPPAAARSNASQKGAPQTHPFSFFGLLKGWRNGLRSHRSPLRTTRHSTGGQSRELLASGEQVKCVAECGICVQVPSGKPGPSLPGGSLVKTSAA